MVKLILPNSAPPGQESQKCLENKCTALVTSRKTRAFITSRSEKNFVFGHLAQREKNFVFRHLAHRTARGDQWRSFSVSAGWWKTEFSARWPKLCTYFRDIFGSPGQARLFWAGLHIYFAPSYNQDGTLKSRARHRALILIYLVNSLTGF